MSNRRAAAILVMGGAAALGLVALVAWEGRARAQGAEVRMAMEAVDPRNLLTGHYAALELRDQLPEGVACPPVLEDVHGRSWIVLRRAADRHTVAAAFPTRGEAEQFGRGVVVAGRVDCQGAAVLTDVGVERLHADQAQAEAIERALRAGPDGDRETAYAVLSVGRDGRARLKGVIVEGRRIDLGWF